MEVDIFAMLEDRMDWFSKGQRRIAQYILDSGDKTAFMTAGKLGKATGVSESTVVRFATDLGFDGYPGLQKSLQTAVMNRLTAARSVDRPETSDTGSDFLSAVIRSEIHRLQNVSESVDRNAFNGAVDRILQAGHIYVAGSGPAALPAGYLASSLNLMMDYVRGVGFSGMEPACEQILHAGAGDVLIVFEQQGTSVPAELTAYCSARDVSIIAVTDRKDTALQRLSEFVIYTEVAHNSTLPDITAQLCITYALAAAVAARRESELQHNLETLKQIRSHYYTNENRESGNEI